MVVHFEAIAGTPAGPQVGGLETTAGPQEGGPGPEGRAMGAAEAVEASGHVGLPEEAANTTVEVWRLVGPCESETGL